MSQSPEPRQTGTIVEVLLNAQVRLRLEDGTTLAAIVPKALLHREGFLRIQPGDRVEIQTPPVPKPARVTRFLRQ